MLKRKIQFEGDVELPGLVSLMKNIQIKLKQIAKYKILRFRWLELNLLENDLTNIIIFSFLLL